MNRILTSIMALILPLILQAQSQPQYRVKTIKKDVMVLNHGWTKFIDATYYYPGNRQGVMDINLVRKLGVSNNDILTMYTSMQYDSVHIDSVHASYAVVKNYRISQLFNPQNLVTNRARYENTSANTFTLSHKETYTYNNGTMTAVNVESAKPFIDTTTTEYRYKNGQLDSLMIKNKTGSIRTIKTFIYNGNNLLNITKTYNSTGKLVDSSLYLYGANNKIFKILYSKFTISPPIDTSETVTYTYDNNGNVVEEYKESAEYTKYYLAPSLKTFYIYDANQRLSEEITMRDKYRDGKKLDTNFKRIYTYNAQSLITKAELLVWDKDSAQWIYYYDTMSYNQYYNSASHIMTFDYEMYWPTSVAQTSAKEPAVKLYPSPSSDFIRVEAVWKEERAFDAMICDMQGRAIRQWQEPANRFYTRTIPIPELPAGVYILKMECGGESFSRQFMKQ